MGGGGVEREREVGENGIWVRGFVRRGKCECLEFYVWRDAKSMTVKIYEGARWIYVQESER